MRNEYPGTCYRCGQIVKAGEGHFEKIHWKTRQPNERGKKWRLQHAGCAIEHRGTDVGKAPPPTTPTA